MQSILLSSQNRKKLFIPQSSPHSYAILEDKAIFPYKCDNFYHHEAKREIIYNDYFLKTNWMLKGKEVLISEKA